MGQDSHRRNHSSIHNNGSAVLRGLEYQHTFGLRVGNSFAAFRRAVLTALYCSCTLHVPRPPFQPVPPVQLPTVLFSHHDNNNTCCGMGSMTSPEWMHFAENITVSHQLRAAVTSVMNRFFGINETHAFDVPCSNFYQYGVAVQVRSGDIFSDPSKWGDANKTYQAYGQPRLSFYTDCISRFRASQQPRSRVLVVCQDFENPVAGALRERSASNETWLDVVTLPLRTTMAALGCIPSVCTAFGTMHQAYINEVHTHAAVLPTKGDRPLGWMNTPEQRAFLLT